MSKIKGTNTVPELIVRQALFKVGLRFRVHNKTLPGKPDIVLKKYKTVVFVNGCFWHGHEGCKKFRVPKTNTSFWINKIERNKMNDEKYTYVLRKQGWQVLTIWECDVRKDEKIKKLINRIRTND